MKTNTRLYSVLNCAVHVSVCRRFDMSTFWFGLVCRRFGLSTFRSVDASVCWCFGMSTSWFVDALICRRFGLSTFRYPSVSVCRRFGCRRFGFSTFSPTTYKRVHFDTPNPVYKYGHHFAVDISEWISSMTFFIISHSLNLLFKYNWHFTLHRLYIVNIFPTFKHFNPSFSPLMPRIKYRTCFPLISRSA